MEEYGKPPIVEAVLEFQFENEIAFERVQKAVAKFGGSYPASDTEYEIQGNFDLVGNKSSMVHKSIGIKLSSNDRSKVIIARVRSIGFAELAPYSGWKTFCKQAQANWAVWRKSVGPQRISRVGLRYINRIDIPHEAEGYVPSDYVTMYPMKPAIGLNRIDFYTMQVQLPLGVDNLHITINTATAPSPLPRASSILLDLDLYTTVDIPMREDHLWEMVDRMREQKNAAFDACITEASKKLFRS